MKFRHLISLILLMPCSIVLILSIAFSANRSGVSAGRDVNMQPSGDSTAIIQTREGTITINKDGNPHPINKARIDELTSIMVKGCSLGEKVSFEVEDGGNIVFRKKRVVSSFKSSREEIPSIISFLGTDESKRAVSNETRQCMQRYMDRIFDAILGN